MYYDKPDLDELSHYGVLGMKWGKRKASYDTSSDFKTKAHAIINNGDANKSDIRRMKYATQSTASKIAKTASSAVVETVISDIFKGDFKPTDPKYLAKTLANVSIKTGTKVSSKEVLARSASKRYADTGKQIGNSSKVTREDAMEIGLNVAVKAAPGITKLLTTKTSSITPYNKETHGNVINWVGNMATKKVKDVAWSAASSGLSLDDLDDD